VFEQSRQAHRSRAAGGDHGVVGASRNRLTN
jgi:hypothetical protein